MAVEVTGGDGTAGYYCTTSETHFGPALKNVEEAYRFKSWIYQEYGLDLRELTNKALARQLTVFREQQK